MAGLMPNAMRPDAQPAPAQGAMPGQDEMMMPAGPENVAQGGDRRATDEEKATYRQMLANTMKALYSEKTADAIAETLRAGADVSPVEGLAQIISSAVSRVAYSGLENGQPIGREMALAATMQAVQDIGTNVAQAAGAPPLNDEQMEAVYLRSIELIAERRDEHARTSAAGAAAQRERPAPPAPAGQGLLSGGGSAPMANGGMAR